MNWRQHLERWVGPIDYPTRDDLKELLGKRHEDMVVAQDAWAEAERKVKQVEAQRDALAETLGDCVMRVLK